MSSEGGAQPGWYPDPEVARQLRYWNGAQWTEHRSAQPEQGLTWIGPSPRRHRNDVVIGWVTAVLVPPIGLLIGIRLLKTEHGGQAVGIVVVASLLLFAIVGALTG